MKLLLTSLLTVGLSFGTGGSQREMFVRDLEHIERYSLNYFSPMGKSVFTGAHNGNLASFKGFYDSERFDVSCTKATHSKDIAIRFEVDEHSSGLSDLFGSSESKDNYWQVYLDKQKPVDLNLSFGYGETVIDLSEMAVHSLKLDNVKADVTLRHGDQANLVKMDTFKVFSEFGKITLDAPEQSRAKFSSIENSYGKTIINIKGQPKIRFETALYIGSGNLVVNLPHNDIPVKIVVKEKHLATFKIPKGFEQLEGRIYVNEAYKKSNVKSLIFNLHGSVGEAIFQIKS